MAAGCGVSSLSLFTPVIVAGLGYKDLKAQLFTVPPYAIAYVFTLLASMLSDWKGVRGLITCVAFSVAAVSFIILGKLFNVLSSRSQSKTK